MIRIVPIVLALLVAVMVASAVSTIAHYGLGITRGDIRIAALGGAGFIALGLMAWRGSGLRG